jgi:hypothetical protein
MPHELPYLPSYKNVGLLFEKIRSAKVPESFTNKYLYEILGLKSNSDRALISLLKALGFLENSGKPTTKYAALKNDKVAGIEIARGLKEAYAALFSANENAHSLDQNELRGLVAQVAGTDSSTTTKIVGTFRALANLADFESDSLLKEDDETVKEKEEKIEHEIQLEGVLRNSTPAQGMRPEFHYNFQIHLPSNGSEETYINIFNAIRKVFK